MDVISELVGVPRADRAHLRALADAVMHREDGVTDVPKSALVAAMDLLVYYADMVKQRRRTPHDDLTSALLEAEVDGDRLGDDEIMAFLFLMVVAGNETTTKLLGNAMYWGGVNPGQLTAVHADHSRIPLWVEETLRYDTSSQIRPGWWMTTSSSTAPPCIPGTPCCWCRARPNRDDRVFEEPRRVSASVATSVPSC